LPRPCYDLTPITNTNFFINVFLNNKKKIYLILLILKIFKKTPDKYYQYQL